MNLLTTEQHKELNRWYTLYTFANKRKPTWNEMSSKAKEIMKKSVDN